MSGYYASVLRGKPFQASGDYTTLTTSQTLKVPGSSKLAVVIQKFTSEVYTAAPQIVSISDGTTTFKFNGNTVGSHELDWGPVGFRFADGATVTITTLSAGPGISWAVFGYEEGAFA